jgi:hypothetical protein
MSNRGGRERSIPESKIPAEPRLCSGAGAKPFLSSPLLRAVSLLLFGLCTAFLHAQTVLLGDQNVESNLDSNAIGLAEAFPVTAIAGGQVGSINFFLDESSAATKVYVGIYGDAGGKPGTLLTQGNTAQLAPGTWNSVTVTGPTLTSGTAYWIAILGTTGGKPYFHDQSTSACHSQTSSQSNLTSLPNTWSTGKTWNTCYISAYAVTGTLPATAMIGNQEVESNLDKNPAGQAEAFPAVANTTGSVGAIALYLDSTSGSGPVYVGLYADNGHTHPGTLLGQGTISSPAAGTWNQASIGASNITAGVRYWIAVLGTQATSPYLRDRSTTACHSETSSQTSLTSLPSTWTTGTKWNTCYISAYGLPATGSAPVLSISPSTLSFSAIQGGANPAIANLNVTNTGTGTLSFADSSDQSWLAATPASGTAPASLQVSATVGNLTAGTYTGHITVTAPGAQNSPAVTTATLTVAAFVPPSITALVSPLPNANGWNNTAVTVGFSCTAGSYPIQACPAPIVVSTQGANQQIFGTVTDTSGSTSTVVASVNIDEAPPTITAALSPVPNHAGWNNAPVTVTFNCSDALSDIAQCPNPVVVSTAGTNQVVSGTAVDNAGNTASTSATINLELVGPVITAAASPSPNSSGWNNTNVTVSFNCVANVSPIVHCPAPQIISAQGSSESASGTVTDAAGNSATATTTLKLDETPPLINVTSPQSGSNVSTSQVTLQGIVSDALSGTAGVTCNGSAATLTGTAFTCSILLASGANSIAVSASDAASNSAYSTVSLVYTLPINVQLTTPSALQLFSANPITVTGSVSDPTSTVTVGGKTATVSGGTFTVSGVTLQEGKNLLTASAVNGAGGVGSDTAVVYLDTVPPVVHIDSPGPAAVVTSSQIDVSGNVNDLVTGTVNGDQVSVVVNGVNATVANRSFVAHGVLLVPGLNTITAVATDRAGNVSQYQVQVTLQNLVGQTLSIISGNDQSGAIKTTLSQPLVVLASDSLGRPMANVPLNFAVTKSDGLILAGQQQGRQLTIQTGANGQASVRFQLGTRNGAGANQVSVSAPGFVGQVVFAADSTTGPATLISIVSGDMQVGAVGTPLPEPCIAIVSDSGGNPVSGVSVTFRVNSGGGLIAGGSTFTQNTDSDGKAYATLFLGQQEGINNNSVLASFAGLSGQAAVFLSSGVVPGPPANTVVSGIVLDNAEQPIANATASIENTNLSALTNAQGQFMILNAPVGDIVLFIDGSTSTSTYTFPTLSFQITTIPGINNTLGRPVYLPAIDTGNSQVVGGSQAVQLTMTGVPGVVYTVAPNSVTFPDGTHVGKLSVSQVHSDRVPMIPLNGTAPRLVATVQPPGVLFNPPMQIQLPNTDGLAPGQVVNVFSFHHDLEQFVVEGTARVSEDGSVVVSDPGFGLTVSGWDGGGPTVPPIPTCGDGCNSATSCGQCAGGSCQTTQQINDVEIMANGSSDPIFLAFVPSTGNTVQFTATVDASGCTNYNYQWNFNDNTTPVTDTSTSTTDSISHTYMAADSYLPTVTVTCDSCAASQQAEVDTNIVQIQITSPCTDSPNLCSIIGTLSPPPAMPVIQGLSAKVVGIDPDPTPSTSFDWTAQVTLQQGDCNGNRSNAVTVTAPAVQETVVGGQWTPNFAGTYGGTLYGGQLQFKAAATVQGLNLTGDTKMQPDNDDEHVLGNNPSPADLLTQLGNNTLLAIACWEGGGNQFIADNSPQHIAGACPNWAHDASPPANPGVGVMQITPNTGVDIWDWTQNATEGRNKLTRLPTNNSGFYAGQIANTNSFNNIVNNMKAQLLLQKIVLADVIVPDLTSGDFNSNLLETQYDVIRGYNGYFGRDQFGLPLHEYQIVMDPSQSYTAFLLTPIDPTTHLAQAQWTRVPASQRPGNNNYVNLVLGQPPLNGGSACH